MAVILNIETSTTMCSVAVCQNGEVIALREINEGYSHAEQLAGLTDKALKASGKSIKTLDAVAVSKGPGSYTGLRIGVSMAKGFCYAADLPLIAINTLEAMSHNDKLQNIPGIRVPMLDARRLEVYVAMYETSGREVMATKALIMEEGVFEDNLSAETLLFFGPGMAKCKPYFESMQNASFVEDIYPSAAAMGLLAEAKFQKNEFEDVAYFEPFYLKEFIAGVKKK